MQKKSPVRVVGDDAYFTLTLDIPAARLVGALRLDSAAPRGGSEAPSNQVPSTSDAVGNAGSPNVR